jgi:hypothetical protein
MSPRNRDKTMKKTLTIAVFLSCALALCGSAFGQTILTTTTLSSAAQGMGSVYGATPTGNQSIITLTSATGVSGPAANTSLTSGIAASSDVQTYLYVDRELMQVKNVSGTTVTVIRGIGSTSAASHLSGAVVFIVPVSAQIIWSGSTYGQAPAVPQGSCTRTSELYLPRIQFESGLISDCLNSQWITGDALQTTRVHSKVLYEPQPGAVLYTSLNTNGTTLVAGTFYCTEIQLGYSKLATGIAVLNGTTIGTDNHLVALYDSGMNLLANSAVAGVLAATASNYQQISFTTPYYMVGPGQYFGCVQSNGTTATVRMLITQVQDQYLTTSKTGVFGTIPATITAPTTFTTAVGPYLGLF